ncbi:hypothetical protein ABPG74_012665 [Tetrahymena malaccensis]
MHHGHQTSPEKIQSFMNRNPFATDTVIQDNQENLLEKDDNKISCFFAEINDLSEDLKYKRVQFDPSTNKDSIYKNREFNCTCQLQDKGIMIMSQGGSSFHLPLEQDVQAVHPMTEGLIIQFQIKKEIKFNDIMMMNRGFTNRNQFSMQEEFINFGVGSQLGGVNSMSENQLYSYVTLNKHPLNSLKVLGILKRSDESIIPWLESYEKIVYVSKDLPILVSYNRIHQRHAIHVIRANIEESEKENTKLNLTNSFYSLSHFNELSQGFFPSSSSAAALGIPNSQIVTEIFFEESIKVNMMEKCQIIKTNNYGEFLIAMLIFDTTCYLKLYSLSFINNTQALDTTNFQVNALKNFVIINDVVDFYPFNLFQNEVSIPVVSDIQKQIQRRRNDKFNQLKVLLSNECKLKSGILTLHKNGSFQLHNGLMKSLIKFDIQFPSVIPGSFRQIKNISEFKNGSAQLQFSDGQKLHMKISPQIQSPLITIIMNTLQHILDTELYHKMLSDVFRNCIDLNGFILPENKYQVNNQANSFQQSSKNQNDEFHNFLCYFIYLLKICNKNVHIGQSTKVQEEEGLLKKVKQQQSQSQILMEQYMQQPSSSISGQQTIAPGLAQSLNLQVGNAPLNLQNQSNGISNVRNQCKNWNKLLMSNYHQKNFELNNQLFKNPPNFVIPENQANFPNNQDIGTQPQANPPMQKPTHHRRSSDMPFNSDQGGAYASNIYNGNNSNMAQNSNSSAQQPLFNSKIEVNVDKFYEQRIRILRILNLLYQDMKIQTIYKEYRENLAYFLYCYCTYLDFEYSSSYQDYYVREFPQILIRYQTDVRLQQLQIQFHYQKNLNWNKGNAANANYPESLFIEKDVPDIFKWINYLFTSDNQTQKVEQIMPIMFKNTQKICKIFELMQLGLNTSRTKISDLIKNKAQNLNSTIGFQVHGYGNLTNPSFPLFHQKVFYMKFFDQEKDKKNAKFSKIQEIFRDQNEILVFLYLIKKNIDQDFIESLSFGLKAPIYESLRLLKLNLPPQLYDITTKEGFKMIKREDIFQNRQIYIKKKNEMPAYLSKVDFSQTINNLIRGTKNNQEQYILYDAHLHKQNNELIFEEVNRLLDTIKDIQIKQKYVEDISEEAFEVESQNILRKFVTRRFSCLIGQGGFNFGSWSTYMTEIVKVPKINLSAVMPNDIKVTLDTKDEKDMNMCLWPEFHNGVATSLKLSKSVMNMNSENLKTWIFYQKPENVEYDHGGFLLGLGLLGYLDCLSPTDIFQYLKPNHEATSVGILLGIAASRIGKSDDSTSKTLCLHIPFLLPPSYDVEIPLNVQTTALIGVGLIHKGTSNRLITEMTLAQIGRKPLSDKCLDREGYSLAAGFSLGLINLGKGAQHTNIKDLELEERLIRFIEGGKIMDPPQSMLSTNFNTENKSSSIKEGNTVNTHVTAPGALIAISLLFLKSNDIKVAEKITIPNSFSTIENCNPNNILLKVMAKNIIMWDQISNTKEFIYNQIPELIRFIYEKSFKEVYQRYYLVYNVYEIDFSTVTSVYLNIIGGCIMAIGLKYAGTGDKKAVEVIINEISKMRKLKTSKCDLVNDPSAKSLIDQYTLFILYSVSVLSLSLVNAGTCDTHSIKIARVIRKKFQDSGTFHYGFNMAINMAIGFLTLGHGNYSFNRDDMSIAALLISIYPYFPNSPSDNKYHLQALRHFYVLAVEQKVFHAVSTDEKKVVNVLVELKYLANESIQVEKQFTPILLQESKKILSVKVVDDEYYGFEIDFTMNQKNPKVIYVKRKYSVQNNQAILSEIDSYEEKKRLQEYIKSIPYDKAFKLLEKKNFVLSKNQLDYILPFRNKINQDKSSALVKHLDQLDTLYNQINQMIQDKENQICPYDDQLQIEQLIQLCIQEDRLELIEQQLHLVKDFKSFMNMDCIYLQNINILINFYENQKGIKGMQLQSSQLFNPQKINLMQYKLYKYFIDSYILNNQDQKAKDLIVSYFTQPENFQLERIDLTDFPTLQKLMKLNTVLNTPTKQDLLLIKKFFDKLTTIGQVQIKDEKEKLWSICQMCLFMSFPLCPQDLLNTITQLYLGSNEEQQQTVDNKSPNSPQTVNNQQNQQNSSN